VKKFLLASVATLATISAATLASAQGTAPGGTKSEAPAAGPSKSEAPGPATKGTTSGQSTNPDSKAPAQQKSMDTKPGDTAPGQPKATDSKSAPPTSPAPAAKDTKSPGTDNKSTTGAGSSSSGAAAAPPPEKRTEIVSSIKQVKVEETTNVNFNISVGVRVPTTVRYHPLPPRIIELYPQWRGYQFILVRGRYIIIAPETHEIVYIIEG
jgi:hypothetical protein